MNGLSKNKIYDIIILPVIFIQRQCTLSYSRISFSDKELHSFHVAVVIKASLAGKFTLIAFLFAHCALCVMCVLCSVLRIHFKTVYTLDQPIIHFAFCYSNFRSKPFWCAVFIQSEFDSPMHCSMSKISGTLQHFTVCIWFLLKFT